MDVDGNCRDGDVRGGSRGDRGDAVQRDWVSYLFERGGGKCYQVGGSAESHAFAELE